MAKHAISVPLELIREICLSLKNYPDEIIQIIISNVIHQIRELGRIPNTIYVGKNICIYRDNVSEKMYKCVIIETI